MIYFLLEQATIDVDLRNQVIQIPRYKDVPWVNNYVSKINKLSMGKILDTEDQDY